MYLYKQISLIKWTNPDSLKTMKNDTFLLKMVIYVFVFSLFTI